MSKVKSIKFLSLLVCGFGIVFIPSKAHAVIPTIDPTSIANTIKECVESIRQTKVIGGTIDLVKDTSAKIGDIKNTVTEYVINNKKKIEAKIKKIEEYKRQVEEYKSEYEEYRAGLQKEINKAKQLKSDVEKGIADAKQFKSDVENGIAEAKGAMANVQNQLNEVQSLAKETKEKMLPSESGRDAKTGVIADVIVSGNSNGAIDNTEKFVVSEQPMPSRQTFSTIGTPALDDSGSDKSSASPMVESIYIKEDKSTLEINSPEIKNIPDAKPLIQGPVIKDIKKPTRKAFTVSSLSKTETLAFAMALSLKDNGTDVNGIMIIPSDAAIHCDLSSKDALEKGAVDDCLLSINQEREKPQVDSYVKAPQRMNRIVAKYVAAQMSEAYKALNDAESFEEKFVDAIKFAPEPTIQDTYANIIELNKAIDIQMNNLLKIYASRMANKAVTAYRQYSFVPSQEEGNDE